MSEDDLKFRCGVASSFALFTLHNWSWHLARQQNVDNLLL